MGTRAPRSVADDVRRRSVEQLTVLFINRPDLISPAPVDLAELAARVTSPTSVRMALDNLDKRQLTVLRELSSRSGLGSLAEYVQSSGIEDTKLTELWERALLWGQPPSDPNAAFFVAGPVHAILNEAFGQDLPGSGVDLVDQSRMGEISQSSAESVAPEVVTVNDAGQVSASQVALQVVIDADDVASWIRSVRPNQRKSGGIGSRDFASLANDLELDEQKAGFLLELAAQAGFFGLTPTDAWGASFEVVLTESFVAWSQLDYSNQWLELARVWSTSDSAPQLINTETPDGERINALSGKAKQPVAPSVRTAVLRALASTSSGQGYNELGIQQLSEQRFPRLDQNVRLNTVRQVLAEGALLGVFVRTHSVDTPEIWCMTDLGRAWHVAREDRQHSVKELFPAEVDQFIAQADMTCVVPGPPSASLRRLLGHIAHRESTGGATVYRITPATIRGGIALGIDPQEILTMLELKSLTPIPQPMHYLVLDAARSVAATQEAASDADDQAVSDQMAPGEAVARQARAQRSLDGYTSAVGNSNAGFGVPLSSSTAETLAAQLWHAHHDQPTR